MCATSTCQDTFFMRQALAESVKGRSLAPPNPWVGCVVVRDDQVIATGYTQTVGKPHAEVMALDIAKEKARGSTVYVTLEPCPNYGKTPPCTEALKRAGVQRVVIGMLDPDSHVNGLGVERLREAGVETVVGVLEGEVKEELQAYCKHREQGLPFCILKAAVSLDGKIAAKDGSSFWITQSKALQDVHQMRAESQAILIGSRTAIKDTPKLTVREVKKPHRPPLRVLLDGRGSLEAKGPLFDTSLAPTLIFTSSLASGKRCEEWQKSGCEVVTLSHQNGKLDLREVLEYLGKQGVLQLIVEGGGEVLTSFIQEKFIDQLSIYMGACLIGKEGVSLTNLPFEKIQDALRLQLKQCTLLGDDVRLDYSL